MPAIRIAWILLGVSVTAEVLDTIGLKISAGFTHLVPTAFTIMSCASAVWLTTLSTKQIVIGKAYALWAGASTALTTVVGLSGTAVGYFVQTETQMESSPNWIALGGDRLSAINLLGAALILVAMVVTEYRP